VGCRSRLLSRGRVRSRSVIVGVRNDEMNGTVSQPMLHSNRQSPGQTLLAATPSRGVEWSPRIPRLEDELGRIHTGDPT